MPLTKDSIFVLTGGEEHTIVSTVCTPNPPPSAPNSSGGPGNGPGLNTFCASVDLVQVTTTELLAALWGWGFNYVGPDPDNPSNYIVCVTR